MREDEAIRAPSARVEERAAGHFLLRKHLVEVTPVGPFSGGRGAISARPPRQRAAIAKLRLRGADAGDLPVEIAASPIRPAGKAGASAARLSIEAERSVAVSARASATRRRGPASSASTAIEPSRRGRAPRADGSLCQEPLEVAGAAAVGSVDG